MITTAFDAWLREVDEQLIQNLGIGYMDLPDQNYYDMFDSGYTPHEAAHEVIINMSVEMDDDYDETSLYPLISE